MDFDHLFLLRDMGTVVATDSVYPHNCIVADHFSGPDKAIDLCVRPDNNTNNDI